MILFLVGDSRSLAALRINFSLQKSTGESSMFLKSATLIHRTGAENQYRSSRSTCNMSCYKFLADNQSCRAEVPHKSYSPCHHPCLLLKLGPKPENFIVFHRFWNLGCPGLWGDAVWCDGFGPIVWSCLHLGIFTFHDLCHPLSTYSLPLTHGFELSPLCQFGCSCVENQVCFVFREASTFWRQKLPSMAPDVDRFVFMPLGPKSDRAQARRIGQPRDCHFLLAHGCKARQIDPNSVSKNELNR